MPPQDLAAVMKSLEDAGATAIHVIAYSLGAQLLLSALPAIARRVVPCSDAPRKPDSAPAAGCDCLAGFSKPKATLKMATCMLMSPDAPLDSFVSGDYYVLRTICDRITLYADEQDVALAIAEFFNRVKGLSRYPFALVAPDTLQMRNDEEQGVLPPMAFERSKLEEVPLDVDVINTSFLDDNVPQLRHINLVTKRLPKSRR